ncbi:MAG: hypothetical protein NWE76_09770 [Candidatus Bathyarchaeota archaeon]|nr:hypothetical protein [Candidatus Bathyarchaeota archaeon]
MSFRLVGKAVHWSLYAVTILLVISGLGITEFRTVESLTFGLLSKSLSFRIHLQLWIPFLPLLALHAFFGRLVRVWSKLRKSVFPRKGSSEEAQD